MRSFLTPPIGPANLLYRTRLILAIALILAIYYPTVGKLLTSWWHEGHSSQGLLILPLCIYLFYRDFILDQYSYHWPTSLLIAGLSIALIAARITNVLAAEQVALLLILLLTPVYIFGIRFFLNHKFIFAYSLLAFPVWNYLTPLAQQITTNAVTYILSFFPIPFFRMGNTIELPAGNFLIAEGCSGIRYLMAALATSALYLHLSKANKKTKITLFFLCLSLSVFGNWIRILTVLWVATNYGFDHPMVSDHESLGWAIFILVTAIWFFISSRFVVPLPIIIKHKHQSKNPNKDKAINYRAIGIFTLAISAAPVVATLLQTARPMSPVHFDFGSLDNNWKDNTDAFTINFPGSDKQIAYSRTNPDAWVMAAIYQNQTQDEELVNENNTLYDPAVWTQFENSYHRFERLGRVMPYREQLISNANGERKLIWLWYEYGFSRTNNALTAKLFDLYSLVKRSNTAAVVAIIVPIEIDVQSARNTAENILDKNFKSFTQLLTVAPNN